MYTRIPEQYKCVVIMNSFLLLFSISPNYIYLAGLATTKKVLKV